MRRIFKWAGLALVSLITLVGLLVVTCVLVSKHRLAATWQVPAHPVAVPGDAASLAEGRRLYAARGCTDCHGADLGGTTYLDDPALGHWSGSNLTLIAPTYTSADWDRTVRQGVKPDGRPTFHMPANEHYFLSDRDLGAIIAYIQSAPRVDRPQPVQAVGVVGRVLHTLGLFALDPARLVDHSAPRPDDVPPGPTAAFGQRLASGQCLGCHGDHLSGGPLPGAPPSLPVPRNLTPHPSGLGSWTQAQFVTAMRTGKRPDGASLDPFMPWKTYGSLSDEELDALWLFLRTVPPRPAGER